MEVTLGTKNYKNNFDSELYTRMADFCNTTQEYLIEDKGEYYEVVAIPQPTESELKKASINSELFTLRSWLTEHDYVGVKIATGRATTDDYKDIIAEMTVKADRINELEAELASL